jgi:outer membrane murein-binding lipoprotein Lpp
MTHRHIGAGRGAYKEETMLKAKTIKTGLAGAAALLMLSACASRGDIESLDSRVSTLESKVTAAQSRASAAEARGNQLETAANQCTSTCQSAKARAEQVYQSLPKK